MTVFRPYAEGDALRSDRSAGDRKRHRDKLRRSIRDNIADIIAEESIIGRDRDRVVKVPIRGIKEYRFIFGDNEGGTGTGEGDTEPGQVVGKAGQKPGQGQGQGPGGNEPGQDIYETEITLDELVDIMFEDLELPDLERKILKNVESEVLRKSRGVKRKGIPPRLLRRRTAKEHIRTIISRGKMDKHREWKENGATEFPPVPYHENDMRYRRTTTEVRPQSNAVVICIMDTSGSMDRMKKYLARSFFFLLYQFVRSKYQKTELVFIAHHTQAKEVDEDTFFHKGDSGGTLISSGYQKALEIIHDRYHPTHWNIYAFHCSDGDNFDSDNTLALESARELCDTCNLFGYGEIKPMGAHYYESSMIERFEGLEAKNFQSMRIERREDIWSAFQQFMSKERLPEAA